MRTCPWNTAGHQHVQRMCLIPKQAEQRVFRPKVYSLASTHSKDTLARNTRAHQ